MVYIDDLKMPYRGMLMSHMIADSLDELHDMARKIGLRREWFQNKPGHPHYDISQSKKQLALSLGAVEITSKELVRKSRENANKN